jgi:hypothetical protein
MQTAKRATKWDLIKSKEWLSQIAYMVREVVYLFCLSVIYCSLPQIDEFFKQKQMQHLPLPAFQHFTRNEQNSLS